MYINIVYIFCFYEPKKNSRLMYDDYETNERDYTR